MTTLAILFYLALAQELYFWWRRQPPAQVESYIPPPPYAPKGSGSGSIAQQVNEALTPILKQFPTFEREVIRYGSWDDPMCIKSIPSGMITFEAHEYDENVRAKITDGTRI